MKICLTGGIACGKSLLSHYLNGHGIETLDADDIVHELIPTAERKRLAATVFRDPVARKALEDRVHPLVKARILEAFAGRDPGAPILVAVVPLLFEVHWEKDFDIICCVKSSRANQIARMTETRGYTREEAEARLAAQMDVEEKAARSDYVIENEGSAEELESETAEFVSWLRRKVRAADET